MASFNFFVETVMGGTLVLDIPHWGQIVKDAGYYVFKNKVRYTTAILQVDSIRTCYPVGIIPV